MFEGACLCGDVSLIYDLFITLKLAFRIRSAAAARTHASALASLQELRLVWM